MTDPVTLPLTIPALRVFGAPVLLTVPHNAPLRGVYLGDASDRYIYFGHEDVPGLVGVFLAEWCDLDLTHPNGERIAMHAAHGPIPSADRETLEALRDVVISTAMPF